MFNVLTKLFPKIVSCLVEYLDKTLKTLNFAREMKRRAVWPNLTFTTYTLPFNWFIHYITFAILLLFTILNNNTCYFTYYLLLLIIIFNLIKM